jgi:hypothetical protein
MRYGTLFALSLAWIAMAGYGFHRMMEYEFTSEDTAPPLFVWPSESALKPCFDRPTLVMFLHPHCPCSAASLDELAALIAQRREAVHPILAFLRPTGFDADWEQTELWRTAQSIPDATVFSDIAGVEHARFQANVSGETFLYSSNGQLLFHGGLTPSRGHRGENTGSAAIESLMAGTRISAQESPTFGCALSARCCTRKSVTSHQAHER